jgi:hypothetical protein
MSARSLLSALLLAPILAACGGASTTSQGDSPRPPALRPEVGSKSAGFCLDGTLSSDASYAPRLRKVVADAVAHWQPAASTQLLKGAPGVPGLVFAARSVTTTSNSTDGALTPVTIDSVAALDPQPDPKASGFGDAIHRWVPQRDAYTTGRAASAHQAAAAGAAVLRMPIVRHTQSGIYNCLGALSEELGPSQPALIVASDMQNNRPIVTLNLHHARVLMVTICPASTADTCPTRFGDAATTLEHHGATSVRQIRADAVSASTLVDFIREN